MPGPDPRKTRLMQGPKAGRSMTREEKKRRAGLGNLPKKKKEAEVTVMQMIDGRQHPDFIKLKKMKKFTNSDGNIEFKAKGGRAGYKGGGVCIRGMNKDAFGKNS